MRYTEIRMARLAEELLADIEKEDSRFHSELRRLPQERRFCRRAFQICWSTVPRVSRSEWRPISRRQSGGSDRWTRCVGGNPDLTIKQ